MKIENNFWRSGSLERYNFGEIWLFIASPLILEGGLGSWEGFLLVEENVFTR
jgi:hypothetical protein